MPVLTPIVCIVGKKKSGKTTLVEKLVRCFRRRGYRVGTIKHAPHGFDLPEDPGDSGRHARAGAVTTVVAAPDMLSLTRRSAAGTLDISLERVRSLVTDVDLVIVEGYKEAACPKIEVFLPGRHQSPCCLGDPGLFALVADDPLAAGVPRFRFHDIEPLADLIEERLLADAGAGN